MIYAELVTDRIEDRGIFYSITEFLPYREAGWIAEAEVNAEADRRIERLKNMPEAVLRYLAPMIRTGEEARYELHRRTNA